MARFRGTVQGSRGEASRLGHQSLRVHANSWQGSVIVELAERGDDDHAHVMITNAACNTVVWSGLIKDATPLAMASWAVRNLTEDDRRAIFQVLAEEILLKHTTQPEEGTPQ